LKSLAISLAVCLGIVAIPVLAHDGATGVVDQRMHVMKSMASEMKALSGMLKEPDAFDRKRAIKASRAVASHAESIPELFPEGSIDAPSKASEAIWSEWETFVTQSTDLKDAALAFETAAEDGAEPVELRRDFNAMANGCKACHEDFRLPG
jgi:cytochrome c556